MAFITNSSDSFDEEEKKKALEGQTPAQTSSIISAGLGSGGVTSPGAPKAQGFATLQKYLSPNEPQAKEFAGKIAGDVQNTADTARTDINQFATDAASKAKSSAINPDKGLVDSVLADPLKASDDQKSAFIKQRTGTYGGPADAVTGTGYDTASNSLAKANDVRALLDTEGGRKQLVSDQQTNKNAGITGLNQALISSIPTARQEIENTKGSFADLKDLLSDATSNVSKEIDAAKANTAEANQYAQTKGGEAANAFQNKIQQEVVSENDKQGALNAAIAKFQNRADLTPAEMQMLGISPADYASVQKYSNVGFDFNPYTSVTNPNAFATRETYGTPEEKATAELIAKLTGVPLTEASAGGYDPTKMTFDLGGYINTPNVPANPANAGSTRNPVAAAQQTDYNMIKSVILGQPQSGNVDPSAIGKFLTPAQTKNITDLMNGKSNMAAGSKGYNSNLIDAYKALFRLGYLDPSTLKDQNVIWSKGYPVPTYDGGGITTAPITTGDQPSVPYTPPTPTGIPAPTGPYNETDSSTWTLDQHPANTYWDNSFGWTGSMNFKNPSR